LNGSWGGLNCRAEQGRARKKQSQNPHPLKNQTPKGCGTQNRLTVLRVPHPPERSVRAGRRKLIHRERFRASVLHLSENQAVLQSIAEKKCLLTTPSFLSTAPPLWPAAKGLPPASAASIYGEHHVVPIRIRRLFPYAPGSYFFGSMIRIVSLARRPCVNFCLRPEGQSTST